MIKRRPAPWGQSAANSGPMPTGLGWVNLVFLSFVDLLTNCSELKSVGVVDRFRGYSGFLWRHFWPVRLFGGGATR